MHFTDCHLLGTFFFFDVMNEMYLDTTVEILSVCEREEDIERRAREIKRKQTHKNSVIMKRNTSHKC